MERQRRPGRKPVQIRLLPEVHEALQQASVDTELSQSVIVERALRHYLPMMERYSIGRPT